ncbi:methyl-accepting chemotaxis protein [Thalassospira profundimaris]|uniref:methyl-accepting chemotaxis protein n=1 Tax=Thalassospira profundimaris TaxID=502049 RepID=UPI000DED688A|nr:methyl-accepting chemotaxis protein [Thalassospira profundimaris]
MTIHGLRNTIQAEADSRPVSEFNTDSPLRDLLASRRERETGEGKTGDVAAEVNSGDVSDGGDPGEAERSVEAGLRARIAELEQERDLYKVMFQNLDGFGHSLVSVRESFAELSSLLGDHSRANSDTRSESEASEAGLTDMVGHIAAMSDKVDDASNRISELNGDANRIGSILSQIDNVSRQTRLLAFNASIEAARAGEAGAGFAVVATEVRALAGEASNATRDIGALVGQIKRMAGTTDEDMQENARAASHLKNEATCLLTRTGRMVAISRKSASVLTTAAMLSEIELANLEELELKLEVYRVFMGLSDATEDDFPPETECRLGQWYYGVLGQEQFARLPDFAAMEEPHRRVHDNAREAVRHYRAGNNTEALKALGEMETSNRDVMVRLRRMIRAQV